jgi:hypothetical protein
MRLPLLAVSLLCVVSCSEKPPTGPVAHQGEEIARRGNDKQMADGEIDLFKVWDHVRQHRSEVGYDNLSQPEKVFVCVWGLEGDVYNGGFEQYYVNPVGDNAREAVDALKAIGARTAEQVVRKANSLFGLGGPSPNRGMRQKEYEMLDQHIKDKLVELEKEYVKDADKVQDLLTEFVRKNPSAFPAN